MSSNNYCKIVKQQPFVSDGILIINRFKNCHISQESLLFLLESLPWYSMRGIYNHKIIKKLI